MRRLIGILKQGISFIGISGIGWIIDFVIYNLLGFAGISYVVCNMFSSLCGVTFVFFVSTRKTFAVKTERFSVKQKYAMYIMYQIVMILLASKIVGIFSDSFGNSTMVVVVKYAGILAKICVTPFTMVCNFVFMKVLSERV